MAANCFLMHPKVPSALLSWITCKSPIKNLSSKPPHTSSNSESSNTGSEVNALVTMVVWMALSCHTRALVAPAVYRCTANIHPGEPLTA